MHGIRGTLEDEVFHIYGANGILIILGSATVTINQKWKLDYNAILFVGMLDAEEGNVLPVVLFGDLV